MASLNEIDALTKAYADGRFALTAHVAALQAELENVRMKHIKAIKRTVASVAEARAKLAAALDESPELFVKPRSQVLHGVKVGFQKGKGKIEYEDADQVVKLIRKHFPEQFDVLVRTTEKPVKEALGSLTAAELKKLGITVEETGDVVLIKPVDGEVDKLVKALLKEGEEDSE